MPIVPANRLLRSTQIAVILLLLFPAAPAWSYLVKNSAFNAGLENWNQQSGSWVHRADDGVFGLGSAETTSTAAGSSSINQCSDLTADVAAGHGLYAFAFGRSVNHTNAILISLELFTSSDCSGSSVSTQQFQVFPQIDTWSFLHTVGTAPQGGVRSARLWATAFSSDTGQTTRIDLLGLVNNAHFNPDFNTDIANWVQGGDWVHAGDDGYGSPNGAALVTIEDTDCGAGNACAFISQCLELSGPLSSPQLFAGGAFKALDNVENLIISHFFYPEPGCGGALLLQAGVGATLTQVDVWQRFTGSFVAPEGSASVAVFVGVNDGTPTDRFLVDSLYLAPPENLVIFDDSFESSD